MTVVVLGVKEFVDLMLPILWLVFKLVVVLGLSVWFGVRVARWWDARATRTPRSGHD